MNSKSKHKKIPNYKYNLIKHLKYKYWELDLELDSCQGCCEDLDGKFKELEFYKEQVKQLGDDINKDSDKIINNIYKKWRQEETKCKQEEERKDKIIKKLSFIDLIDLDMYLESIDLNDTIIKKTIHQMYKKINEICDILRKQK